MRERSVQKEKASNHRSYRNRERYEENDGKILRIIESEPGLRIGKISTKVKLQRRIVREHLRELEEQGRVAKRGVGYFMDDVASTELNELVKEKSPRKYGRLEHKIRQERGRMLHGGRTEQAAIRIS